LNGRCRVCGQAGTNRLGGYVFCDAHYARARHHRRSIWHADVVSAALLVGFVLAVAAVDRWLRPEFTAASLMVTGVVLAVVPAAVWLTFFYRRDRLEPEPVGMVLEVFVLGALLAGAVGIPLVDRVFAVHTWLYRSPWSHLLGAVLVVGFTQEFLKYAAVRFSVYDTPEFDELVDGVVYASAAGIGYATALNIAFVVESGGVDLGLGAVRIVLTVLAHAAIAGITGYHLGANKLQPPARLVDAGRCRPGVVRQRCLLLHARHGDPWWPEYRRWRRRAVDRSRALRGADRRCDRGADAGHPPRSRGRPGRRGGVG